MTNHRDKNHASIRMAVGFALAVFIVIGVFLLNLYYYKEMQTSLRNQIYHDLEKQNDSALNHLQGLIQEKFQWLELFAAHCEVPEESGDEKWQAFAQVQETDGVRIGVADLKGTIYYGANRSRIISSRSYFKQVLKGENTVSRLLPGEFDGQDGIILASPIIRDRQVIGAVCMEYTKQELETYADDSSLRPYGGNMIVTETGELVAAGSALNSYKNILDYLKEMSYKKGQSLAQVKQDLKENQPGYLSYEKDKKRQLLYYQPSGIANWLVASVIDQEEYSASWNRIRELTFFMIAGSLFLLLTAVSFLFRLWRFRRRQEKQIQKDYLTGVYTRETAGKLIAKGLRGNENQRFYACMFLDIDDFKKINDTFGHYEGDVVLTEVGKILNSCTRKDDVIVRFGGDEFCIWLYGEKRKKQPEVIAERILNAFRISGTIQVSIGITLIKEKEYDYDAIIKRADDALYEAKKKGKNQFAVKE